MRAAVLCVAWLGLAGSACAADLEPFLRGADEYVPGVPLVTRWSGLYAGGQFGYTTSSVDFGSGAESLVSYILRNDILQDQVTGWTTMPKGSTSGTSFGGFIGYNMQWEQLVIGADIGYNRMRSMEASSAIRPYGCEPPKKKLS